MPTSPVESSKGTDQMPQDSILRTFSSLSIHLHDLYISIIYTVKVCLKRNLSRVTSLSIETLHRGSQICQ